MSSYPQRLGDPGYDELLLIAVLSVDQWYEESRVLPDGTLDEAWVAALVIAKGGELVVDGVPSDSSFLLISVDAEGDVIDDWVELTVEEAKQHGAVWASAEETGLTWESIGALPDAAAYVRSRIVAG